MSRARPIVARTSESASCAWSCPMPLALLKNSSLKHTPFLPAAFGYFLTSISSQRGHLIASPLRAQAAQTSGKRSQREQPFLQLCE